MLYVSVVQSQYTFYIGWNYKKFEKKSYNFLQSLKVNPEYIILVDWVNIFFKTGTENSFTIFLLFVTVLNYVSDI